MFGIRFIKSQPTTHLMHFRGGKLIREGAGLSRFYYAPVTTMVRCLWPATTARSCWTWRSEERRVGKEC